MKFSVALIGDSLIQKPCCYYKLLDQVRTFLPYNYRDKIDFYTFAIGGNTVSDVIEFQLQSAIALNPDCILLFKDSDVSSHSKIIMSGSELDGFYAKYTANLRYVIQKVRKANILFAIGGPEILYEGPFLLDAKERSYNPYKWKLLGKIQQINKDTAAQYNNSYPSIGLNMKIPYMDIRQGYLDAMPTFWRTHGLYKCWVTEDGEHPNYIGVRIIARYFADAIQTLLHPLVEHNIHHVAHTNASGVPPANTPQYCEDRPFVLESLDMNDSHACAVLSMLAFFVIPWGTLLIFVLVLRFKYGARPADVRKDTKAESLAQRPRNIDSTSTMPRIEYVNSPMYACDTI